MGNTTYKELNSIWYWLYTALKHEWEKHIATPVKPNRFPGLEMAQSWGFVVAGYSLLEQGLKAVLHMRGKEPEKTHALSVLFAELLPEDQDVLREYYDDFLNTFRSIGSFSLRTLDDFLENLDGEKSTTGCRLNGSFEWRYFLTEEGSGAPIPLVSINVMHELMYGCVQLVGSFKMGEQKVRKSTYSWRLHKLRSRRYNVWLSVRENSEDWDQDENRLEILWGPGYGDRYDYYLFENGQPRICFAPLPDHEESDFPIINMKHKVEKFDVEQGCRSIGLTMSQPQSFQELESMHVMET